MATQNLATFKYQHTDRLTSPMGALGRWLTLFLVVGLLLYLIGPGAMVAAFVGVIVLFATWPKRRLCLGPRYLVCGDAVVYYANVKKMVLRSGEELILTWADGSFILQKDKFPTNARKDAKIRKNKAAKFEKVSNGIIRRVLLAAPSVETSGINRVQVAKKGAP